MPGLSRWLIWVNLITLDAIQNYSVSYVQQTVFWNLIARCQNLHFWQTDLFSTKTLNLPCHCCCLWHNLASYTWLWLAVDNVWLIFFSYRQFFDLEGESGIVVRAIGTSVTLGKQLAPSCVSPQLPLPSNSPNPEWVLCCIPVSLL